MSTQDDAKTAVIAAAQAQIYANWMQSMMAQIKPVCDTLKDGRDFISGSSNQVKSPTKYVDGTRFMVFFDSGFQSPSQYTYDPETQLIKFSDSIPLGTTEVNIRGLV